MKTASSGNEFQTNHFLSPEWQHCKECTSCLPNIETCDYQRDRRRTKCSSTRDKKIPPRERFLLFLSGTVRGCLVQAVWHSLLPYCSFTSVVMMLQRKAQHFPQCQSCRDVKENIIGIFLFKMHISRRYKK